MGGWRRVGKVWLGGGGQKGSGMLPRISIRCGICTVRTYPILESTAW